MTAKTILAFDIGLKRTGVAVGQTLLKTAQPAGLLTVKNGQFMWSEVDTLINKWEADLIVIGDPKTKDPHLNKAINRFKSHVQQQHKLPIIEQDETLTSDAANAELAAAGLSKDARIKMRDQIAARLILEAYFEQL